MSIFYDRIADQVEELLPEFYREDGPRFISFIKAYFIRRISPLMSPTGQEAMIPIEVFSCGNCGKVPDKMMPKGDE